MTILLILFVPTFFALFLAIEHLLRKRQFTAGIILFFAIMTTVFHFYHFTQYWAFHELHTDFFILIRNIISCSIFPFVYLYLSNRVGIRLYDKYFKLLIALIFFNFIGHQNIMLDNEPIKNIPKYNFDIRVYYEGKAILNTWMYVLIMTAQAVIFSYKIIRVKKVMATELLSLNPRSKLFIYVLLTACALIIIELFLPSFAKESQYVIYFFTTAFAILTTVGLILIKFGYQLKPLLNKEGQPILLQVKPKLSLLEDQFIRLIDIENLYTNPDLAIEDVVVKLNTNTEYVKKMLKKQIGLSFTDYINHKRIEKAKKLITSNSIISLEEIARECGFKTTIALTKTFKEIEGYTPSAWIKRVRKHK